MKTANNETAYNYFTPLRVAPTVLCASLALLLTSCVIPADEGEQTGDTPSPADASSPNEQGDRDSETLASSPTTSTELGSDLQIDIYTLERLPSDILRLRFGVTNNSGSNFLLNYGLTESEKPNTPSRISLIDPVNQKRLLSYEESDGSCYCSEWDGNIGAGDTEEMWVAFPSPAPDDVETLTGTTPLPPPFMDIPITEASQDQENPSLGDPRVLDLTFISDDTEDNTGREESNEEVSILLSSDVLFDTNESNLSSEAEEILDQVASEIDQSSGDTVNIDGHTDNTGNPSVNDPLSVERAKEVEEALTSLVEGDDVSFEVEGHGSSDPIANNDTEEGKERNRRVSVTFEK